MDAQANTSLGPSQHTRACLLCEALLWQLTQAHAVLTDSVRREFYDRTGFKSEADRAAGARCVLCIDRSMQNTAVSYIAFYTPVGIQ